MKNLDYFRYYPVITVNNKEGLATTLGGYLSVCLYFLVLGSIALFGKDFYLKQNPTVVTSSESNISPFISSKDFFIAIGFELEGNIVIHERERYLNVHFGYLNYSSESSVYTIKEAVNCSTSNNQFMKNENNLSNYYNLDETNYYCPIENMLPDLKGSYGGKSFLSYDIRVSKCINTTENDYSCKSNEEIDSYLKIFFTGIIYSDNLSNPTNLKTPIQKAYRNNLFRVSSTTSRQILLYYSNLVLDSDEGALFSTSDITTSYTYDSLESDIIFADDTEYFFRIIVSIKSSATRISRTYTKISKVAADVGGVTKSIMVVLYFINYCFARVSFIRYFKGYLLNIEMQRGNKHLNVLSGNSAKQSRKNSNNNDKNMFAKSCIANDQQLTNKVNLIKSKTISPNKNTLNLINHKDLTVNKNTSTVKILNLETNNANPQIVNYTNKEDNSQFRLKSNFESSLNHVNTPFNNLINVNKSNYFKDSSEYQDRLINNKISSFHINNVGLFNKDNINSSMNFNVSKFYNPKINDTATANNYFNNEKSNSNHKLPEQYLELNVHKNNSDISSKDQPSLNNNYTAVLHSFARNNKEDLSNETKHIHHYNSFGDLEIKKFQHNRAFDNKNDVHEYKTSPLEIEKVSNNKVKFINKEASIKNKYNNDNAHSFSSLKVSIEKVTSGFKEQLRIRLSLWKDFFNYYVCYHNNNGKLLNGIHMEFVKKYSVECILDTIEEHYLLREKCIKDNKQYEYWVTQNLLYRFATSVNYFDDNTNQLKDYLSKL